jgi:hypothetical protein
MKTKNIKVCNFSEEADYISRLYSGKTIVSLQIKEAIINTC